MSKRAIWLIILLMGFSLIGLLSFQFYWIKRSIDQKEAELETDVQKALANLEESMQASEALVFVTSGKDEFLIDSLKDGKNSFEYVANFRVQENEDSVIKDIERTFKYHSGGHFEGGMMIVDDNVSTVDVIHLTDSNQSRIKLVQRFNEKKFELSEAIDQLAFEFAFKESSFTERIKALSFDSLLNKALEKEGLADIRYAYRLTDQSSDSIVIDKMSVKTIPNDLHFEKELLSDGVRNKGGMLEFSVDNKFSYLLSSILPILSVASLLTLLLLYTFFFTLKKIYRQKKLSTMKSDFINNMTHEFKTPIATISLAIDSIFHPEVIKKEDELKKYGSIIKKENERMHQQVERLLQTAMFENGKLDFKQERVSTNQLIKEVVDIYQLRGSNSADFQIALDLHASNDMVVVDGMHFFNAIRNILDNAIKFSKEKVEVLIKTHNRNSELVIQISDKGIGMSSNTQKQIYESFYRFTEGDLHPTKGFGLGLSYVKKVIDQFNASIEVQSKEGVGSTFIISIQTENE